MPRRAALAIKGFADGLEPKDVRSAEVLERVKAMSYGLRGFVLFCSIFHTEDGKLLKLFPEQRKMLRGYFGGVIETLIVIPKKNGKTTLLALLALYHLYMVHRAECLIGASSRDQATYIYGQAVMLVEDAHLADVFDIKGGYREIRYGSGRIRVLAADARTQDGAIPTLALVDELHRHRNGDLYTVFRKGLTPRRGQMITISTAGATIDSPLGEMRRKFYELETFSRKGAYVHAVSPDGSSEMHEWCLDPEADVDDIQLVKTANPAPWHTIASLRREHDAESTAIWDWLRFSCGIWTEGEEPPFPPALWDSARGVFAIGEGSEVWLGVDLGPRRTSAAIAVVQRIGDDLFTKVHILEGKEVSYTRIEGQLRDLWAMYDVGKVVYTSKGFERSADMLEEEGMAMELFPSTDDRMTAASATFYRLLEGGNLHHDGDQVLRAHVMGCRTKATEKGWRFVKDPDGHQANEGLFAILGAVQVMLTAEPPPFVAVGWV